MVVFDESDLVESFCGNRYFSHSIYILSQKTMAIVRQRDKGAFEAESSTFVEERKKVLNIDHNGSL